MKHRFSLRTALLLASLVLLLLTLNAARIPLTVFAFLGGALAIGVGFGTQTIIRNFISGLIVLMERQVQVGDTIEVDGVTGTVEEVNLRSSTVRAFDGVEAIIPNSSLLENRVTNWTKSDLRIRRVVKVGVAYGSDKEKVREAGIAAAKSVEGTMSGPGREPDVWLVRFGDSSLDFELVVWVSRSLLISPSRTRARYLWALEDELAARGLAIPFPQRDLHLKSGTLRIEGGNARVE